VDDITVIAAYVYATPSPAVGTDDSSSDERKHLEQASNSKRAAEILVNMRHEKNARWQ
jgi:hypothetical protein